MVGIALKHYSGIGPTPQESFKSIGLQSTKTVFKKKILSTKL